MLDIGGIKYWDIRYWDIRYWDTRYWDIDDGLGYSVVINNQKYRRYQRST